MGGGLKDPGVLLKSIDSQINRQPRIIMLLIVKERVKLGKERQSETQ